MNVEIKPHLILVASEQVWPNLHALVHWSGVGQGLGDVWILHTAAVQSREPAERLRAVLTKAKDAPFRFDRLELLQVDTSPNGVASAVREVRRGAPEAQWVVVANGGLKTMTLGLLEAMADEANVQVVYAELGALWQRVVLRDGRVETFPLEGIVPHEMDQLPVVSLITAQHTGEPGKLKLDRQEVESLDICQIARACMAAGDPQDLPGWDWRRGFSAVGLNPGSRQGPLFERWCGGLLRRLGVQNLVGGLEVRVEAKAGAAAESDLLAIHAGRFYYIELKLIDDAQGGNPSLVQILRTATELCRTFAGASAVPVLLLPNWRLTPEQHMLCELFFPRPRVLDASDSANLISWLANTLGVKDLPQELRELELEIGDWMRARGMTRAFGNEPKVIRDFHSASDPQAKTAVVGQLAGFTRAYRRESHQNWMLLADTDSVWLEIETDGDKPQSQRFRPHGSFWRASARLSDNRLLGVLKKTFGKFVNRQVPVSDLVAAWEAALGWPHAGNGSTRGYRPLTNAALSARQTTHDHRPVGSAFTGVSSRPTSPRLDLPAESVTASDLPSGPDWSLQRRPDGPGYLMRLGQATKGLSCNEFPEAIQRVEVSQDRPGEPRQRRIYFHPHLPIGEWLKPFNGQPYRGPSLAQALRDRLAA